MGLWRFSSRHGEDTGLLTLYMLHSLDREPKSGYDLIKEITEKTGGLWVPSKGTLYPILRQFERKGLVLVCETGNRSKTVYCLTDAGRLVLEHIKQHKKEHHDRLLLVKNLLFDIFGEEKTSLKTLYFEIGALIDVIPLEAEAEAIAIVKQCHTELQRIEQHASDTR